MRVAIRRKPLLKCLLTLIVIVLLVTFFVLSLSENKQAGSNFNLKYKRNKARPPRIQRKAQHNKTYDVKNDISSVRAQRLVDEFGKPTFDSEGIKHDPEQNSPLDVYVFEEHHEALPYWFREANRGIVPKFGNTLVHIDGHSDMAPPVFIRGYPFFKWPTKRELKFLMQRNDAFIQSAMMAGLITRIIWVWPEWDRENHKEDYAMSTVKLGWTQVNTTDSPHREVMFCMCQKTEDNFECIYPKGNDEEGIVEVFIEPEDCHIKKVTLVEEIHEQKAITFLKKRDWISESENVMLDIDEDFFGCSYVIKPLLDTNISMDTVKAIDENLRVIVCPKTTTHEEETNRIILKVVSMIRQQKLCSFRRTPDCLKTIGSTSKAAKFLTKLLTEAQGSNTTNFCFYRGKRVNYPYYANLFVKGLSELTTEQLRLIYEIGFCSTTTPKTLRVFGEPEFGLCYGANTPLESAVTEFNPTLEDISERTEILGNLFTQLKNHSPRFVTLCRSVRDGYTPRRHFTRIENDTLTTLSDAFGSIKLHYDKDLLGGKKGRQEMNIK